MLEEHLLGARVGFVEIRSCGTLGQEEISDLWDRSPSLQYSKDDVLDVSSHSLDSVAICRAFELASRHIILALSSRIKSKEIKDFISHSNVHPSVHPLERGNFEED